MTTSTLSIDELKSAITAARSRGDQGELQRLQAAYRMSGQTITSAGRGSGGTVALKGYDTSRSYGAPVSSTTSARISLSGYVLDELRGTDFSGWETGFWLVGQLLSDGQVEIVRMVGSTDDGLSTYESCVLDFEQAQDLERYLPEGEFVIGHLHSQPSSIEPSSQDFVAWVSAMEVLDRSTFVGLIVHEDPFDVAATLLHRESGHVTHRSAEITTWRF
jgi:hypothetical protein